MLFPFPSNWTYNSKVIIKLVFADYKSGSVSLGRIVKGRRTIRPNDKRPNKKRPNSQKQNRTYSFTPLKGGGHKMQRAEVTKGQIIWSKIKVLGATPRGDNQNFRSCQALSNNIVRSKSDLIVKKLFNLFDKIGLKIPKGGPINFFKKKPSGIHKWLI